MMDQPSILELVDAVRAFLEQRAMPELKGHTAFHARVAANALGIVSRQLKLGDRLATDEKHRLVQLVNKEGTLEELNRALCQEIRAGRIDLETPGFKDYLITVMRGKVEVDQPNYSGLRRSGV